MNTEIIMDEIKEYEKDGFTGFVTVAQLRGATGIVPCTAGVYVVIRRAGTAPQFVECGTGGHFKKRNPNVPISELEDNVVEGSATMYIGKATNLKKRLGELLRFGAGANIGHWGGRYLWQLADAEDLIVAWKETPDEDPRAVEARMITGYMNCHGGQRPFANLQR